MKSQKIRIPTIRTPIPHTSLPKKFQSLCPQNYQAHTSHIELKGVNSKFVGNNFDIVPEFVEVTNPRTKRATTQIACQDYTGQESAGCHEILGKSCPDGFCPSSDQIYRCKEVANGQTGSWYYVVPCDKQKGISETVESRILRF